MDDSDFSRSDDYFMIGTPAINDVESNNEWKNECYFKILVQYKMMADVNEDEMNGELDLDNILFASNIHFVGTINNNWVWISHKKPFLVPAMENSWLEKRNELSWIS